MSPIVICMYVCACALSISIVVWCIMSCSGSVDTKMCVHSVLVCFMCLCTYIVMCACVYVPNVLKALWLFHVWGPAAYGLNILMIG